MELTIRIDNRKKEAKAFLDYMKNLPFIEICNERPRYNSQTEKSIKDAILGVGIHKAKNVKDLFIQLNS